MAANFDPDSFTRNFLLTKSYHRDLYPAIDPSNPELDASGKVVIITGAGGGLGNTKANRVLLSHGPKEVLLESCLETLDLTSQNIAKTSSSAKVVVVVADVVSETAVEKLFDNVKAQFGKADVLINTVGTMNLGSPISSVAPSQWWTDYESNVKGPYLTAHFFIRAFGGQGTIINLVSSAASLLIPGSSSYSSAKLAQVKLGEYIDLEQPNIRVFSVHPGLVQADDRGMVVPAFTPIAKDTQALTGGLTLYLASPKADYLRGGFVNANWDVTELEKHKEEIVEKKLTKLAFLNGQLGPEGHPWSQ